MLNFFEYNLAESLDEVEGLIAKSQTGLPVVVNCLNPHSYVLALDDEAFHSAIAGSDILLPDGEGVCMAVRKCYGKTIKKIAGDDLHRFLIGKVEQEHFSDSTRGRIYYMGSSIDVLNRISNRIQNEHPTLSVRTFSPPFCQQLSDDECKKIIDDINAFQPDVVFVGLGAPKQEKWSHRWTKEMNDVKVVANIGAVFEFYAGIHKRAPQWVVRLKMEWLVRLLKEPRRMWKRVFVSGPRFMRHVKNRVKTKK